ncbi:MAG TPA: hypothetical protein VG986_05220, partial [Pseudolabrys sp.]|nr:hypothetical protein [Pseudolabrys sp.]
MAEPLPIAEIVHAMPGRARLRIAGRRGDAVFFAAVATGLSTVAGVYKVDVRPFTGSLLIQHGPPLERIAAAAKEARLFAVGEASAVPPPTEAAEFNPKMLVGLGLAALGLWQLTEGKILPPAITLGWYAAHLAGLMVGG